MKAFSKQKAQPAAKNFTEAHRWNTADTMTLLRIAASLLLLFLPLHSFAFFAAYTLAGLTDALDGWLARRTGTASDFGAKLDSIADLLFYGAMLLRFMPVLLQLLPDGIWYAVAVILLVRLAAYGTAAIRYHRFASLHTWLNKLTGAALFLLPYILAVSTGIAYCQAVCVLAFAASLEELVIHLFLPGYQADRKSVFQKNKQVPADPHPHRK